jgi:hypothetical protein
MAGDTALGDTAPARAATSSPVRESAQARYDRLYFYREPFLWRAYDAAKLTIPSVLPPRGHSPTSRLPQPYQGLGARGTTNLANRLMTALLPTGANHFRLSVPIKELVKQKLTAIPQEMVHQLAALENMIQEEIDRLNWREMTNLVSQHLVVTGNVMECLQPDGNIKLYRLDQYVVVRDPGGRLTEFVVKELFTKDSLPEKLQGLLKQEQSEGDGGSNQRDIPLYTWGIQQPDGSWKVHQELCDDVIPGSDGTYKADTLPWWPLRWSTIIGEDYGRGKIEEHYADLFALDGLSKAMLDGAAMASRNVTLIRPNAAGGLNLRRRIATANNGDQIIGNPEDVSMLQFQNVGGMQFVGQLVEKFRQELGAAFLLSSAMRRDAERVTATELRADAEELDGALGGVYSILNQDMALPRIKRLIYQMQAQGKLPEFPKGMIEPTVLVGLEALGRQRDLQKIGEALQVLQPLPPEVVQRYPKWDGIIDKIFVAVGLPDSVKTQAEVAEEQKQEALMQALQQTAPTVADKLLPDQGGAPAPGNPQG